PFTIYRAGFPSGNLTLGVGTELNANSASFPFSDGAIELANRFEDRRLLLRGTTDLTITFTVYELGCTFNDDPASFAFGDYEGMTVRDTGDPIVYSFNGDCDDAGFNNVFLGREGANPDDLGLDHVRIDTQTFPIDADITDPANLARLLSFRINEVQRPDRQANIVITRDRSVPDPIRSITFSETLPECYTDPVRDANLDRVVSPVYRAANLGALRGVPLWEMADPATNYVFADYVHVPSLNGITATGFTTVLNTGVLEDTPVDRFAGATFEPASGFTRLQISDNPIPAQPGLYLIERPDFDALYPGNPAQADAAEAAFYDPANYPASNPPRVYTTTPPNPSAVPGLSLQPLLYASKLIAQIDVDYRRRADELVSLADRVRTAPDGRYRSGERATLGYSVLYRQTGGRSADQFALFTYSLTPQRNNTEWFPQETIEDIDEGRAPLLLIDGATLAYDDRTDTWTLTAADPGPGNPPVFSASPGQLLLFAGVTNSSGSPEGPGADEIVRVTRVTRTNADTVEMTLDRAPRARGRDLLDIHYPGDLRGSFDVWWIQARAESITPLPEGARSLWALDPIEARIFQAGDQP
ncbi:MAG: hypothetical protein AAGH64_01270, partial [Planctomycetota bacterium]